MLVNATRTVSHEFYLESVYSGITLYG